MSAPLRILVISDTPADLNSGAAGTEMQTIAGLRALGHQVDALWREDLQRRIAHPNLHSAFEAARLYERAAVSALRRRHYDVVHANQPYGYRAARAIHRQWPRTILIHRSHGFEANVDETLRPWLRRFGGDRRPPLRRLLSRILHPVIARQSRAIARAADGHILLSTIDADFLHDRFGVDRGRIAVIPLAPPDDYAHIPALPMTPERLGNVLHVAQFAFFKAPMITAAAMRQLAAGNGALRFTWVCGRDDHEHVRRLLGDLRERVELLDWMPQDALRRVYDRSGIFLFPSFYEGFGKTFIEAMSRGLCVVATDAGGMHDIIESGRNGVLVPPGDAEALARAAAALIAEPARAEAMSAAAAADARRYTWLGVARATADFYRARLEALPS